MDFRKRLSELGIEMPAVAEPLGGYVPAVVGRDTVVVSGQLPLRGGQLVAVGRVGEAVSLEAAQEAARVAVVNGLAAAEWAVKPGPMRKRFERVLRVGVFVASGEGFTEHHRVADGASGLLAELGVGEEVRHARAAVGVSRLPLDAPVEVELLLGLRPESPGPDAD
ncbi:MAG: RidA family protein [Planctomycetota bacterium]